MDLQGMHSRAGGKWTDQDSARAYERALGSVGVLVGPENPMLVYIHEHPGHPRDEGGKVWTLVALTPNFVISSTFSALMDEPSAQARPWRALTGLEVTVLDPRDQPGVVDSADLVFVDHAVTISSQTRNVPEPVITKARRALAGI